MAASLIKYAGPGSVKDIDAKEGLVTAYAAAFGGVDHDGDTIHRGAFAKTIRERGPGGTGQIKMLYMHRFDEPIGKVEHLEEDDHGLLFRARLLPTQRGKDAAVLYEADLFEHSVGIDVIRPDNFRGGDIDEVRLYDVSPVTWGANPNTPTLSVKSLSAEPDYLPGQIRRLRKALRAGLSDETAKDLETGLALLEAQLAELIKSITPTEDDALREVLKHLQAPTHPAAALEGTTEPGTPQTEEAFLRDILTQLRAYP